MTPLQTTHTFTVHAICPVYPDRIQWDYYTVRVRVSEFVPVESIEETLDTVRGKRISQEELCKLIRESLDYRCSVIVTGCHSLTSSTECVA